jgi:hypothetical protein
MKKPLIIIIFFSFFFYSIQSCALEHSNEDLKSVWYFEAGGILGSPSIGGIVGYWFGPVGIRVSGGYQEKRMNGIQFNLGYKLTDNNKTRHAVGVALGRSQDRGCDYSYLGPVYDLNYKWFFLEIGVGKVFNVKRGDFSDLPWWIILQVGYMHRFI